MNFKKILKIILFIFISGTILVFLSGCSKSDLNVSSNLEIDNSYDSIISSINTILEKNEQYEYVDTIIQNITHNTTSYKLNIFCKENNDKQIMNARNKRISEIERKYGSI